MKSRPLLIGAIAAGTIWFAASAPAVAQSCAEGYVAGLASDTVATVARGGDGVNVVLFLDLCAGDVVTATQGRVQLALSGGEARAVAAGQSYTVGDRGGPFSAVTSALSQLAALFAPEQTTRRRALLATRNADAVNLPLRGLVSGDAQIVAGPRTFSVEWTGGQAPYTLEFSSEVDGFVVEALTDRAYSASLGLDEGAYSIIIRDATGDQVEGAFFAVDAPPPVTESGLTGADAALFEAVTRAQDDAASWSYEAYLTLRELEDSAPGAEALADLLVVGERLR